MAGLRFENTLVRALWVVTLLWSGLSMARGLTRRLLWQALRSASSCMLILACVNRREHRLLLLLLAYWVTKYRRESLLLPHDLTLRAAAHSPIQERIYCGPARAMRARHTTCVV